MEVFGRRLRRPIWLGSLRHTVPISGNWGYDRGTPVDRYYIERFLEVNRGDVRGACVEVGDSGYIERFGSGVASADVLDINPANPHATIVADLADADSVPTDRFDCFILTQVLQFVYDMEPAVRGAHRLLRPDGVLLATLPTVSRIDRTPGPDGEFWRFTAAACDRLFGDVFGAENVTVRAHGNVLVAIAFLTGLAWEELSQDELDEEDPYFPVLVTVRGVKRS
jgi:SAM-dependent methyltransferase